MNLSIKTGVGRRWRLPWWLSGKESACNAGDPGLILGWEDPREKGTATHSSILAWRIPWTEEPGGLQSTGSQRVGYDWVTKHACVKAGDGVQDVLKLDLQDWPSPAFLGQGWSGQNTGDRWSRTDQGTNSKGHQHRFFFGPSRLWVNQNLVSSQRYDSRIFLFLQKFSGLG